MQVSVVEEVSSGEMLLQTGEAVMGIMKEFQVLPALTCVGRAALAVVRALCWSHNVSDAGVDVSLMTDHARQA